MSRWRVQPERREFTYHWPIGWMDQFQFNRFALGFVMVLPAIAFTIMTLDGMLDLIAGRPLRHLGPRTLAAIAALACATGAIRLMGRTLREAHYAETGKTAHGTITAVEEDHSRWYFTYRFQDGQGLRREGRFMSYAPEWTIGDQGDVCYADGWDGSLWISMSERPLPPGDVG